jgi:hypothetical protein
MIKAFIKYLLPLCFLLVSGYNYMYASSYQAIVCHSPIQIAENSAHVSFHPAAETGLLIMQRAVTGTKKFDRIYVEKNEEDTYEVFSTRKLAQSSIYFSSFYTRTVHQLFSHIKMRSFFSGLFSYYSSNLYIILRVIRI